MNLFVNFLAIIGFLGTLFLAFMGGIYLLVHRYGELYELQDELIHYMRDYLEGTEEGRDKFFLEGVKNKAVEINKQREARGGLNKLL